MFLNYRHTMKNMLRTIWRVLLAASLLYPTGQLSAYADNTNLPDLGDESIAVIRGSLLRAEQSLFHVSLLGVGRKNGMHSLPRIFPV